MDYLDNQQNGIMCFDEAPVLSKKNALSQLATKLLKFFPHPKVLFSSTLFYGALRKRLNIIYLRRSRMGPL